MAKVHAAPLAAMALLENASSAVGDGVPRGEEVAVDMTPVAEEVLDLLRFHVRHALYKVRPPALSIAAPKVLTPTMSNTQNVEHGPAKIKHRGSRGFRRHSSSGTSRGRHQTVGVGFGRIVASEIEAPNMN